VSAVRCLVVAVACATLAPSAYASSSPAYSLALDSEPAPLVAGGRVGTWSQAVRAFGRPTTVSPAADRPECTALWTRLALRITFSAAQTGVCARRTLGSWQRVRAAAPRWHTEAGLHVGDGAARLHALYPQARRLDFVGAGVWEVEDGVPLCDGGPPLGLTAQLAAGVVRSLAILHVPACG
jgi:hypothetical protein